MPGKKISELNAATEVNSADLLAAAQDKGGGVLETRKLTLAQFLAWLREKNDPRYAQLSKAAHFLDTLDVDGAVALADTLRVAKKATLEGDLDVDGAVALLQMLTVGGDPLIKAKDAAKLAGGDDADFAAMPKVGGVDVISSGRTGAGGWAQLASGVMFQWTEFSITPVAGSPTYETWVFPKKFDTTDIDPILSVNPRTVAIGGTVTGWSATGISASQADIYLYRSNTTATILQVQAMGFWS